VVHNDESLSNVEKFNHLLSCLEKEALLKVKANQITKANFAKANAALITVYDNPCLLYFRSVSRLFELQKIHAPSASALWSLIDPVTAIYESLLSFGNYKIIANAMKIQIDMQAQSVR